MGMAAERQFPPAVRDKLAHKGAAMPNGSFPIENAADLKNAIRLAGHAKDPVKARQHIIGRAKALGLMKLVPSAWLKDKAAASKAQESEGEIRGTAQENLEAFEAVWVDNAEGLPQADIVIIRPGEGLNRRTYSREAIAEAVGRDFWGGVPMFADHGDKAMPRKRSIKDIRARIEPGTSYVGQEGEARAKATFFDPPFASFMKAAGKSVGLSAVHEFIGQRYRGNDGHYHERVDKFAVPHSVDFVAYPAQGGEVASFISASESEDDVDWDKVTEDMVREHRPDLVDAIVASAAEEQDPPEEPDPAPDPKPDEPEGGVSLATVRKMVQEQTEALHESYETREKNRKATRASVTALLAKSGLPERTKSRLMTAFEDDEQFDEKAVQTAIDTAAEDLKEVGWHGPVVKNLGNSDAQESDDKGEDPATLAKLYPTMMAVEEQLDFKPRIVAGKAN